MNSFLNKDGLIHFSNKIKEYINKKTDKLGTDISTLDTKVDSDKLELKTQIVDGDTILNERITNEINATNNKIEVIDDKVDINYTELKADFNKADFRPTGDSIIINNIEQFAFNNVRAGETIVIPYAEDNNDFLIQCYAKTDISPALQHKVIDFKPENKNLFEYDSRYVEITSAGAKPKTSITLSLTKDSTYEDYNIYTTDILPQELVDSFGNITSYEVK